MAPKRRRISAAKAQLAFDALGEEEERNERKDLLVSISTIMKEKDTQTLRSVKAMLEGRAPEAPAGARLPRGVRFMGGASSISVPAYLVNACVAMVLGKDEKVFDNVANRNHIMRNLFLFAIQSEPEEEVPEKRMLIGDFKEWYHARYKECKNRLTDLKFDPDTDDDVDWQVFGSFVLAKSSEACEAFDIIRNVGTGSCVPLPMDLKISEDDVGVKWEIRQNWSFGNATLCHLESGMSWHLANQFKDPNDSNADAPPRRIMCSPSPKKKIKASILPAVPSSTSASANGAERGQAAKSSNTQGTKSSNNQGTTSGAGSGAGGKAPTASEKVSSCENLGQSGSIEPPAGNGEVEVVPPPPLA